MAMQLQINTDKYVAMNSFVQKQTEIGKTAIRTVLKFPLGSLFAIFLLAILLTFPAAFCLFYNNMQVSAHSWENSPKLVMYLTVNTSEDQAKDLFTQINLRAKVGKATYISPQDGVKEIVQQLGVSDLLGKLPSNPLPSVIEILPATSVTSAAEVIALADELKAIPEVASLQMNPDFIKHYYARLALWHRITVIVVAFSAIALLFSMVYIMHSLILHTKLSNEQNDSSFSTQWFYSGILVSFLAGLFATILLALLFFTLNNFIHTLYGSNVIVSVSAILKLLFAGLIFGLLGTWIARRFF